MSPRWRVLVALFLIRTTMGFQFQAVASLSPQYLDLYGIGLADLGFLIGLYLSPGILFAIPGGAIGQRFGETRVVAAGLILMAVGGALMAAVPVWEAQVIGRALAGIGGVTLNVMLTKLVTDWFAGREIATAMGLFVNSWPVGIGLALVTLPGLAGSAGLSATLWIVPIVVIAGLVTLIFGYRTPPNQSELPPLSERAMTRTAWIGMIVTGAIWGFYNGAIVILLGFGPLLLVEAGWTETAAASGVSLVPWMVVLITPFGGMITDRLGRAEPVLCVSLCLIIILLLVTPNTSAILPLLIALGLTIGLSPGAIMSLPSAWLSPGNRAFGMGVYFGVYYVAIFIAPILAGAAAEMTGSTRAAFYTAAGMAVIALACVGVNYRLRKRLLAN